MKRKNLKRDNSNKKTYKNDDSGKEKSEKGQL